DSRESRESLDLLDDRRRLCRDPLEGIRRYAEAGRHGHAVDARKLSKVRGLSTNDGDLGVIDLLKAQHVVAHPLTPCARSGMSRTCAGGWIWPATLPRNPALAPNP